MKQMILSTIDIEELADALTKRLSNLINKKEVLNPNIEETKKKEFLTREETAKLCNVKSLTTLWNWKNNGKLIPRMRAGKKPLYHREDVINFLNGN